MRVIDSAKQAQKQVEAAIAARAKPPLPKTTDAQQREAHEDTPRTTTPPRPSNP